MMSWRIIYIEQSDYLNLYLDNLKITKGQEEFTLPLCDINSIVVDNYKTTLTVNLINKCMEYNVNIITCGFDHLPEAIIQPYSGNYRTTLIQLNQINWDKEVIGKVWKIIVNAKIENQINVLKVNEKSEEVIEKLKQFNEEVEDLDSTNREGLAAKMYFRELFDKDFTRREDDVINSCLNYGYSIIRSMIARTLVARGLNPHIGIFHYGPNNSFNLADDIIEVFRPIVDNFVYENFREEEFFTREIRLKLVEIFSKKIEINNQKETFHNVINKIVDNLIKTMETGDVTNLAFPDIIVYDI